MSTADRIERISKDPRKKEALDKAREKIRKWKEDGRLHDHLEIEEVVIYTDDDGRKLWD